MIDSLLCIFYVDKEFDQLQIIENYEGAKMLSAFGTFLGETFGKQFFLQYFF